MDWRCAGCSNRAIRGRTVPKYVRSDHDPLYRFHQWQANPQQTNVIGSRSPARTRRNVERRRRRKVIPMGRFSYADQHRAVVTSSNWMRLVVRENVRVCGYSEADQVPLVTFLEAIAARSADKNRA